MGEVWDEFNYVGRGYTVVQLFKKGDFNNRLWYDTPDHPPLARYLYGIGAQFDVVEGKEIFNYDKTYARLVSVILSSLTAVFILLIGWRYFSPFVAVLGAVIFAFLPLSVAYGQLATLESVRLFFYAAAVYYFFLFLEKATKWRMLVTGIFIGCVLEAKQTGVLLYPALLSIYYLWKKYREKRKKQLEPTFKKVIVIFIISLLTFFALWPMPWLHLDYTWNYTYQLWFVGFSKTSIPEVFFGKLLLVPQLYYVAYFVMTTPLLILLSFFAGLLVIDKKKNWLMYSLVILFLVPFILSFYNMRQHGVRFIIEMYLPLALISAIGIEWLILRFFHNLRVKIIAVLIICLYLFVILFKISPYYLNYFNEITGGTNYIYKTKMFQMGWWGDGEREAGLYIKDHAPKGSTIGLALSPMHTLPRFEQFKYQPWDEKKKYDYVIVNYYHIIRDNFNDSQIRKEYKLVYEVKADQAVLVSIYKRK